MMSFYMINIFNIFNIYFYGCMTHMYYLIGGMYSVTYFFMYFFY